MEDTAREGNALCTIFSLTSENFRSKVVELDWLGDATGFVETIHVCMLLGWWRLEGRSTEECKRKRNGYVKDYIGL